MFSNLYNIIKYKKFNNYIKIENIFIIFNFKIDYNFIIY